jgi:transglutaminase-like putative cysteine protease
MGFLSIAINTSAQQIYKATEIPATLRAGANAVIRNMETEVSMVGPEQVVMTVKKAVTILNKAAEEYATLILGYNKSTTIKSAKGYILDAGGNKISNFTLSNFLDQSAISDFSLYEDDRIKYYNPVISAYPFTIVYEYEIRFKQNLVIPDWYANAYPDLAVENSQYRFNYLPGDKLRIKAYNFKGQPVEGQTLKQNSYTWTVKDLPAFKQEPYAPSPDDYRTYVKIATEKFSYYRTKGTSTNWDDLGKWIYTDLIKSRQALSPEVVAEMKTLVNGLTSDKEKAKKIYEYMQQKTRYISVQIGLGGFQPMFANDVQRLGYGDCKALVSYMQSLLKAVDIPSIYCVVNAGRFKQNMDPEFASMDQGNHVILCLPLEKDTTWLECTSQTVPFGYLGDFTDDRTVLACAESGGKLLRTPKLTPDMNVIKRDANLTLDKDGNITGTLHTTFKGSQYDTYEPIIKQPLSEQIKMLKDYYDIDNVNFRKVKITQDKTDDPVTSENLNIEIASYVPKNQQLAYLVVNAFNKLAVTRTVADRRLPLYINRGYTDEDQITYHLPEGYTLEYKPKDIELKSTYGSFSTTITHKGNDLIYTRKFVLNSGRHPAKDYPAFADFMNGAASADRRKVILKTN